MIHTGSNDWNRNRRLIACLIVIAAGLGLNAYAPLLAQDASSGPSPTQSSPPADDGVKPTPTHPEADHAAPPPAAPSKSAQSVQATPKPATPSEAGTPRNPMSYKLWVVFPAVIAILLAILFRQVVPALVIGILVGAYMLVPCLPADDTLANVTGTVAGFRLAMERYLMGSIVTPGKDGKFGHIMVILFTLIIGFTVGVIGKNGGTRGMVNLVAGRSNSARRGALTAWLAGMIVFFDDYANTMIVGPTMRSVFDRVKLSRAKLAYIIDSTAAPVASIALIGTWVGAEVGYIQSGLDTITKTNAPAFLLDAQGHAINGMTAFINSLSYRFYPILALLLVFLIALTGRDFGPMKRSERKVLSRIDPDPDPDQSATPFDELVSIKPRWWLGFLPIAVLVGVTVAVLIVTGSYGTAGVQSQGDASWWQRASAVVSNGDAYLSIFHGALLSAIVAVVLTLLSRACSFRDALESGIDGMTRMFPAIVILVLAWSLSSILQDLKLGDVVAGYLEKSQFSAHWLPLAIFATAAAISFATGTSWGTMGILCPLTVEISTRLAVGLEPAVALNLFYASVGSVLAGAVFGDHCSPISDTTVLSSIASGCRHEEHVWTQLPYALVVAAVSMGLGNVLCSVYHQPWYFGLIGGGVFLFLVVFAFGRRPTPSFELAEA